MSLVLHNGIISRCCGVESVEFYDLRCQLQEPARKFNNAQSPYIETRCVCGESFVTRCVCGESFVHKEVVPRALVLQQCGEACDHPTGHKARYTRKREHQRVGVRGVWLWHCRLEGSNQIVLHHRVLSVKIQRCTDFREHGNICEVGSHGKVQLVQVNDGRKVGQQHCVNIQIEDAQVGVNPMFRLTDGQDETSSERLLAIHGSSDQPNVRAQRQASGGSISPTQDVPKRGGISRKNTYTQKNIWSTTQWASAASGKLRAAGPAASVKGGLRGSPLHKRIHEREE
ncbi:hypothetical protein B0H10DRAFT_1953604 [Mycena sp. CBHHK59/15]|nr:hypothetical protein B0H10DRAFT_1953604 [Mycena sp. CBHHK59/15]